MLLSQSSSLRHAVMVCAGLTGLLSLAGCSLFHRASPSNAAAPPAAIVQSDAPAATAAPQTVTDDLPPVSDTDAVGTTTVISDAGPEVKAGAPKSYVVRRGDTLWGIANMFLRDPWLWPEIWYINPDIHNPHRIYPGDTVRLAVRGDGRTALQVLSGQTLPAGTTRLEPLLRTSALEGPIATIPYSLLSAFLARTGVLSSEEIKSAPYILALADDHDVAGAGHELYVKKLDSGIGSRYSVVHIDEQLKDPDKQRQYGHLTIYTGTAQVTQPGRIAKLVLTDSARETLQGDVLVAEEDSPTADFAPHAPSQAISGRVMAVVDNVQLAGQFQIVAINRGTQDGLNRGTVLTVEQQGAKTEDLCAHVEGIGTCTLHGGEVLPNDTAGTLLVFKTYAAMSYALIMSEVKPIHVNDKIRNP